MTAVTEFFSKKQIYSFGEKLLRELINEHFKKYIEIPYGSTRNIGKSAIM